MSIATKLAKLKTIKQDIKSALEEKGQTPSNVFSTYANNIRAIETGGITPSGEIKINENGTYDVTNYASANVNVASSGGSDLDDFIDGNITELTSNTTKVRNYLCQNFTSLTNVSLPNAITLGDNAFQNCTSLVSVSIPSYVYSSGNNSLFNGCTSLKDVYMPKAERFNGYGIFYQCTSLESIDLPLLHTLDNSSFLRKCTNLKQVNLPKLGLVYDYTFEGCTALTNISLPSGRRFASYCFNNCSSLDSVDIGKLEMIDDYAFDNCYSLKSFTILNKTKVARLRSAYVFDTCYHIIGTTNPTYNPNGLKDGYIYVPASLLSQYKVATNWTNVASQIVGHQDYVVGDELVNYSNGTFTTCTWYSDKEMTIAVSSVESNGRYYCKLEA